MSSAPLSGRSRHGSLVTAAHRADPAAKLVCLIAFLFAVVATPPRAVWAFAVFAALVLAAATLARLPARLLLRRLVIELPFVAFALALPFLGSGPQRELLGVSVSVAGCWAAWAILAKATLGTAAAVVLAWTTPVTDILAGLERLHLPRALVAIAGFMVRYLDLVTDDLGRLQIARVSRGDDPRWAWQARAVTSTAGTLFVRSYERGERVHQAMLARGFDGTFPSTDSAQRTRPGWWPMLAWPAIAWTVTVAALLA